VVSVTVHFRGAGTERLTLAFVPAIGSLMRVGQSLWRVSHVVLDGQVTLYVIAADVALEGELETWSDVPTAAATEPTERQKGLFQ